METSESFVFVDKPAGVTTHTSLGDAERARTPHKATDGFKEYLDARADVAHFVVHRLDRETTGTLCLAKSAESAARIAQLFIDRSVEKTYLFLTDFPLGESEFVFESFIERKGSTFVSTQPSEGVAPNSRTRFRKLESWDTHALWQAEPESGKPHQIRLHAQDAGIPLLGDTTHGGSPFPVLCLHSHELSFEWDGKKFSSQSPPPRWFHRPDLIERPSLVRWLASVDRRERLQRSSEALGLSLDDAAVSTQRLLHSEADPLRVEKLGPVHWLSWYSDSAPSTDQWSDIEALAEELGWTEWYLQVRGNRGRMPNEEDVRMGPSEPPLRWTARENGVAYELRRDSGLSPGLFLDQRRNRAWIKSHSSGKRVLNLFCYTGGFSVCAALGGAAATVSVDVSKAFLEWTKANFALNGLALEGHEFRAIDSREYLDWAAKKGITFDLIVCDPPSFGRSNAGIFRIESDANELLQRLYRVTAPGGTVLFSTNFEKWEHEELVVRTEQAASALNLRVRLSSCPDPDWDFELPREARNMKSIFISPISKGAKA